MWRLVLLLAVVLGGEAVHFHYEGHREAKRREFRDLAEVHMFSYQGETGPRFWGELSPDWAICGNGTEQSPLNLMLGSVLENNPYNLSFHYPVFPGPTTFHNNGHTWLISVASSKERYIYWKGDRYNLLQFHVHSISEHQVEGKPLAAELHFVHEHETSGDLLVVGLFLRVKGRRSDNQFLAQYWDKFTKEPAQVSHPISISFEPLLNNLDYSSYWTYAGSLTAPPCSEGVTWVVITKPQVFSLRQQTTFVDSIGFSARFTQPRNGRV